MGGTAVQIMSRSANSSSLIREREGTRGPLSGQGPGSNSLTHTHTQPHADICKRTLSQFFSSCTYLHTDAISLFLTHTHTHIQEGRHTYTDDTGTWRSAGAVWGIENCLLRKAPAN